MPEQDYLPNEEDKAKINQALELIRSTQVFKDCDGDYDFNIGRSTMVLQDLLNGNVWFS